MALVRNVHIFYRDDRGFLKPGIVFNDVKKVELLPVGHGVLSILTKNRVNYCYPLDLIQHYQVSEVIEKDEEDGESSDMPVRFCNGGLSVMGT